MLILIYYYIIELDFKISNLVLSLFSAALIFWGQHI